MNKRVLFAIILACALVAGVAVDILLLQRPADTTVPEVMPAPMATSTEPSAYEQVIGRSVEDRAIIAKTFGSGAKHVLFVGGIHGGYEWNSVLLAYTMINYLTAHPEAVPNEVTVSIIPDLNPDGVYQVVGKEGAFTLADVTEVEGSPAAARFNANDVDLNRNFDCKWQATSSWRGQTVSAGSGAFSEPEAQALRDYVASYRPTAVLFWHSQANNVYASECENGVLPSTIALMDTYATAAGYGKVESFDAYPITGDAEGWLASLGIPAVTVELGSHDSIEWDKNLAGTLATLKFYSMAK